MKVLQFLLLFMFIGAIAKAQPPADSARNRGQRVDMFKDLNLTKDQQDKVKAIQDKQREEMETLRNGSLSRDEQRTKMMDIRKKYNEQIEAILTPEQKEKYKAKQKQMQEQMQRRQGGGGPGGQGGGNN
ncbi:MAG: Spy/CpxP family protein refolding chaperone [Lacibacter sp.]